MERRRTRKRRSRSRAKQTTTNRNDDELQHLCLETIAEILEPTKLCELSHQLSLMISLCLGGVGSGRRRHQTNTRLHQIPASLPHLLIPNTRFFVVALLRTDVCSVDEMFEQKTQLQVCPEVGAGMRSDAVSEDRLVQNSPRHRSNKNAPTPSPAHAPTQFVSSLVAEIATVRGRAKGDGGEKRARCDKIHGVRARAVTAF